MSEKELEIHNRKKELLRMLGDIHREIVFNDLEDEGFEVRVFNPIHKYLDKLYFNSSYIFCKSLLSDLFLI